MNPDPHPERHSDPQCRQAVVVNLPDGLHMRPASLVAQLSGQFACEVRLVKGEQTVNAKSMLDVMTLGAVQGTELILEACGEDASLAVEKIAALFAADFAMPGRSPDPRPNGAPSNGTHGGTESQSTHRPSGDRH
jgi:phosphocarrier protein